MPIADRPDIPVCGGWRDFQGMGISAASVSYGDRSSFETFTTTNTEEFHEKMKQLRQDRYLVGGFNNFGYDDLLYSANIAPFKSNFDILRTVKSIMGVGVARKGWSFSLDNILRANNMQKTGSGTDALKYFHDGEIEKLLSYCENDTVTLYNLLIRLFNGTFVEPNTLTLIKIRGI